MLPTSKPHIGRRQALIALGLGAVAASPLSGQANANGEKADEKRAARYKESEHVKTYYRVNRYPR
jgi:hypothetical protein